MEYLYSENNYDSHILSLYLKRVLEFYTIIHENVKHCETKYSHSVSILYYFEHEQILCFWTYYPIEIFQLFFVQIFE